MTSVRIYVTYKPSVFDPQGETIKQSVNALGHKEVKKIVVGKFFDVTLAENDQAKVEKEIKDIAESLLVNFNMETYKFKVLEDEA